VFRLIAETLCFGSVMFALNLPCVTFDTAKLVNGGGTHYLPEEILQRKRREARMARVMIPVMNGKGGMVYAGAGLRVMADVCRRCCRGTLFGRLTR
jgi:hypothetical protein